MLAVQALWAGPPPSSWHASVMASALRLLPARTAATRLRRVLSGCHRSSQATAASQFAFGIYRRSSTLRGVAFTPSGNRASQLARRRPEHPHLRIFGRGPRHPAGRGDRPLLVLDEDTIATFGAGEPDPTERAVRVWSIADRSSRIVARWQPPSGFPSSLPGLPPAAIDPQLEPRLAYGDDAAVHLLGIAGPDVGRERALGNRPAGVTNLAFAPDGSRLASADESGGFRVWPMAGNAAPRTLDAPAPSRYSRLSFDASGSRLGWGSTGGALVWSLERPSGRRGPGAPGPGRVHVRCGRLRPRGPLGCRGAGLLRAGAVVADFGLFEGPRGTYPDGVRCGVHRRLPLPRLVRL